MKEKIIDTAADMFLNLGFKSVTMDDLANEMGISKKTIYTHFENKTKLVQECTFSIFNKINTGIELLCASGKNPIEELYEIKKIVISHLKAEKSSPQYQLQKYYPKIYANLRAKQFELMLECTVNNIKRGIEMDLYRENLNIEFVARIYISGVSSIKDFNFFPKDSFTPKELQDYFLEYHLRGIVTPKGRKILNNIINSTQE